MHYLGGLPSSKRSSKSPSNGSSVSSSKPSQDKVGKSMQVMQGVNKDGSPYIKVKDGLTGKIYNSPSELMASYGY